MTNYPPQTSLLHDARSIIASARHSAVRSVAFHRVEMYWTLDGRIFIEQQQEQVRALSVFPTLPDYVRAAVAIAPVSIKQMDHRNNEQA